MPVSAAVPFLRRNATKEADTACRELLTAARNCLYGLRLLATASLTVVINHTDLHLVFGAV